jgi:hypothetical protein
MYTWLNIGSIIFLNPVVVMIYIMHLQNNGRFFTEVTTNSYRMFIMPYASACLALGVVYVSLMYAFHIKLAHATTFTDFLKPNNLYLSAGAALTALFTLWFYASKDGMEFNIFAFFFAPALICGMGLLTVTSYQWLQSTVPVDVSTQPLNMWVSTLLISFSPVLICFIFVGTNKGEGAFFDIDSAFTAMITVALFYAVLAACHFVLFKIMGRPATFSGFFVVGSSFWQMIPYLSGLVFATYQLGLHYSEAVNRHSSLFSPLVSCIVSIGILFMILNYMRYFKHPV